MHKNDKILDKFGTMDSKEWILNGRRMSLDIFHKAAKQVPAYRDFLKKNNIKANKIKTWEDFQSVPFINKKNYLLKYKLSDLCWNGSLNTPLVFTSSSGSTGKPVYFPRGEKLDYQASVIHDLFLNYSKSLKGGPVLVIDAFGMGVWIGGLITYKAFEISSRDKNYSISVITTGINKKEIIKVLRELAPSFNKIILAGYPPFIKDILDMATEEKINLKKNKWGFVFAAETFTEGFRDYLVEKTNIENPYRDFLHIYGSADIGAMAAELPVGVLIKRLALKDKKVFSNIFDASKSPTLAQFITPFINFESVNSEIILTGYNTIPLIRYAIGDRGEVLSFDEMNRRLLENNINLKKEAKKASISKCIYKMPFVYIYERSDMTASLYGINIYPQVIKDALLSKSIANNLTGKFAMETKFDKKQNQYLEINLELRGKRQATKGLKLKVRKAIVDLLLSKSSEFKELYNHLGEKAYPKLVFFNLEHPKYFKSGGKQKWVKK